MHSSHHIHIRVALCVALLSANAMAAPKVPTISQAAASKIALARVPKGHVKSAELENEQHKRVWSFDIAQPHTGNITEILVDAHTGAIVDVQHETPKQQAAETAADKAEH